MKGAWVFAAALAAAMAALPCFGQNVSSRISGTVLDASGAIVVGARVELRCSETGQVRGAVSNSSGVFVFADLLPGSYQITVESSGFKKYVKSDIRLDAKSSVLENVTLSPGVVTEVVEVHAAANEVETANGENYDVVDGRQISELSLNGRNYIQLLQLVPGVSVDYTTSFNLTTNVGAQHVNGMRGNSNGLMVDGAYNLDQGSNSAQLVNPSVDALQEVKVSTSSYGAEYGHAMGGQINLITKSGTQRFHGVMFEFVRNDAMDAEDWISNRSGLAKQSLRFNDAGFNLGGPVYIPKNWNTSRSKMFFFFSNTYRHYTLTSPATGTVPTAAERAGDFRSSSLAVPTDPKTKQPYNPGNTRVLPPSLWSVNGPKLLKPFPLPNIAGQGFNFITSNSSSNPQVEQIFRLDYTLTPKTLAFFRWVRDDFDPTVSGGDGSALGIVGSADNRHGDQFSLNVSRTISPAMVNVFNFSLSGSRIHNLSNTGNFQSAGLGLNYPKLFPSNRFNAGPDVSIQGFTGYSIGSNLQNYQWNFVWRDDLSYVRGTHAMKFGVWIERFRKNANVLQSGVKDNGSVTFNRSGALSSGNTIADTLLGNFQQYTESGADSVVFTRYTQMEGYAQDSWRARPNLTVEYGLRYVISPAINSAINNIIAFRPEFYDRSKAARFNADGTLVAGVGDFIGTYYVNGLSLPGDSWPEGARGRVPIAFDPAYNRLFRGVPRGLYDTRYNNLAPRLSFAWDPSRRAKWSVRGGGGIYYDRIRNGSTILTGLGVPFLQRTTLFDANIDNPVTGRSQLLPSAVTTWAPVAKTPTVYSFSLGVQHSLPGAILAEVRYVATLARYITMATDLNQLPVGTRLDPAKAAQPINAVRPYPGFGTITWLTTQGSSNYDGLQVSVKRRLARGLSFGVAYTYSKTITNAFSEQSVTIQNSYDLRDERGLATFDRTQVLVYNYVYELPFFRRSRGWVREALAGWQFSGITNMTSGEPVTPSFGLVGDPTGTGATASRPDFIAPVQYLDPRQTRTFVLPNGTRVSGSFFFDPTVSFARPPTGRFGNGANSLVRGPGANNWDASLFKNFRVRERANVQFRSEFFNVFNHTQFSGLAVSLPATTGSSQYGQVNAVAPARIIQLGLKFLW